MPLANPKIGLPPPQVRLRSNWIEINLRALVFGLSGLGLSVLISAITAAAQTNNGALQEGTLADPKIDERVEYILQRLTLKEKVGQLVQYSAGQPTGPGTGRTDYEEMIAAGEISALLNVVDPKQINLYQHIAMEKSRMRIPILFGLDVLHGFKTEFPIPLALASTWDPSLVEKAARVSAMETSADGIRWTYSPMVDIARDARWGRIAEGAGEDPFLGSAMAAAFVRGYQGSRLDAPDSIAACAKHFVGYGAAEGGREYNTTEISDRSLRQFYLPPFWAAVGAGAASVMSAFNSLNGVPASANAFTLKQVLRKEWGFRGLVVSDWESITELMPHGIAADRKTAARKAFVAGVDMDMASSAYHDHLQEIIKNGESTQADLDESVRHVLRIKFALGLFEHPFVDEAAVTKAFYRPESIALAQRAAEQSLVLLKNANGPSGKPLLPLSRNVKNIALIGPAADDSSAPKGPQDENGRRVSLLAALEQRIGRGHVSQMKGTGILDSNDADMAAAVEAAQRADLVILALGESPDMSGEAASRSYLGLPGKQQQLMEAVVHTGKPVVLLIFSGRPLTLPWAFEHVPAAIAAWFPGIGGGPALSRVLFGDVKPSAKLVVTWPRSVGQVPLYYNSLNTGRPPGNADLTHPPTDADSRYLSRYIDEQNTPQFPFGYGDSYTKFSYGATTVSATRLSAVALNRALKAESTSTVALTATADVTNTGTVAGEEIVQLYIHLHGTALAQPVRVLKGFERVALAPRETKKVKFEMTAEAFATWNERNEFAAEPAEVSVWISPDSASGLRAQFAIRP